MRTEPDPDAEALGITKESIVERLRAIMAEAKAKGDPNRARGAKGVRKMGVKP